MKKAAWCAANSVVHCTRSREVYPPLANAAFIAAVVACPHVHEVVICESKEADVEIARLCRVVPFTAVITNDSDFLVCDLHCRSGAAATEAGVVLFGSDSFRVTRSSIRVKMAKPSDVARLLGLPQTALPTLACLVGNDTIDLPLWVSAAMAASAGLPPPVLKGRSAERVDCAARFLHRLCSRPFVPGTPGTATATPASSTPPTPPPPPAAAAAAAVPVVAQSPVLKLRPTHVWARTVPAVTPVALSPPTPPSSPLVTITLASGETCTLLTPQRIAAAASVATPSPAAAVATPPPPRGRVYSQVAAAAASAPMPQLEIGDYLAALSAATTSQRAIEVAVAAVHVLDRVPTADHSRHISLLDAVDVSENAAAARGLEVLRRLLAGRTRYTAPGRPDFRVLTQRHAPHVVTVRSSAVPPAVKQHACPLEARRILNSLTAVLSQWRGACTAPDCVDAVDVPAAATPAASCGDTDKDASHSDGSDAGSDDEGAPGDGAAAPPAGVGSGSEPSTPQLAAVLPVWRGFPRWHTALRSAAFSAGAFYASNAGAAEPGEYVYWGRPYLEAVRGIQPTVPCPYMYFHSLVCVLRLRRAA